MKIFLPAHQKAIEHMSWLFGMVMRTKNCKIKVFQKMPDDFHRSVFVKSSKTVEGLKNIDPRKMQKSFKNLITEWEVRQDSFA